MQRIGGAGRIRAALFPVGQPFMEKEKLRLKRTEHRQEDPGRGPRFAALVRIWGSERLRLFLSPILFFLDLLLLDGSLRLIHNGTGITGVKSVIPWGFTICCALR